MADSPPLDLVWIVPLYRTGRQAEALARRCDSAARQLGLRHEILFVDDCDPEHGYREVEALHGRLPVRLLRLACNQGQDGAIREGLRTTRNSAVLVIDGDLQDPPEALADLWARFTEGYDAVFADRRGRYEESTRLFTSRLYRRVMGWVGGLPPGAGLYVLMHARVAASIASTTTTPIYLLAALAATRGRFTSVNVQRSRRTEGVSAYTSWRRLRKGVMSLFQTLQSRRLGLRL
jgi:glycosyltransferase involved in cell wall biosynthesis